MNFQIINDDKFSWKISYSPDEYAFSTDPYPPFWNSVLIDYLEILLDIEGRITGIWGLCPHTCWKISDLILPKSRCGGVICEKFTTFESRIPIRIANNWPIYFDNNKGWVCIGNPCDECEHIEVVSGLVLSINNNVLYNIWIKFHIPQEGE